ncbi:ABC transporter substrate-binding protein [Gottfriedia acidiceleris]|uniref:ABC transporter substrate-binding protein n=1 Tax=Gottfriedia acidiceleris TaxID=371036 RepID=UPI00101C6541|nr:extracellular solute-binding protein [Gottfriedia acidiceleris]
MEKILKIAAAASVALTMAACNKETSSTTADKKIVINYANWNLGTESEKNLERLMIEAYEKTHKNIDIKIDENITNDDWKGSLSTAASAGKLPDVFMLSDIPSGITNDWLLDISDLVNKDKDFTSLPESVKESTKNSDKTYAIPFAQHFMGYYVNKDIFNNANIDAPEYGISLPDFINGIKDTTDLGKGIVGINSTTDFVDWYSGAKNENVNWFTYGSGKYHLDSPEMFEGVKMAKDLGTNGYAYEGLNQEQKDKLSGDDIGAAFKAGQIAYFWNGTWMNSDFAKNVDFDWDFVGIPGGRTAMAVDYLGVAKSTKYKKEAYDFAKFMSFGKDGFLKRMDLSIKSGTEINTLPITTDSEVLAKYWDMISVPGVQKAYENLDKAMIDPIKIVPGYAASRWEATTGIKIGDNDNAKVVDLLKDSVYGSVNYQDYAKQLNDLAQQQYDNAVNAMKK